MVSDGGTRPFRVHLRDPSFNHLQALPVVADGGLLADVIPCVASIGPIIGGGQVMAPVGNWRRGGRPARPQRSRKEGGGR